MARAMLGIYGGAGGVQRTRGRSDRSWGGGKRVWRLGLGGDGKGCGTLRARVGGYKGHGGGLIGIGAAGRGYGDWGLVGMEMVVEPCGKDLRGTKDMEEA